MFASIMTYKNRLFDGLSFRGVGGQKDCEQERGDMHFSGDDIQDRPLSDVDYSVIDVELTGLHRRHDSLVSLGAMKMKGTGIYPGKIFYSLVRPSSALKQKSILLHGITPQELEEAPEAGEVLPRFLDFIGNDVVVGHFVTIDRRFINKEIKRVVGGSMQNKFIDTAVLHAYLEHKSGCAERETDLIMTEISLSHLADIYGISQADGRHNALVDAYIAAQLFQRLLTKLKHYQVATLGELLEIGSV